MSLKPIMKDRVFLASGLSHTTIDIFNSSAPVLVAFLSVPAFLNLSNAQVGLATSIYAFLGAIGQPLFGWLADRFGSRWLLGPSVAWTVFFVTLATFTAESGNFLLFLIPFSLAAVGSSAFHPVATMNAAVRLTTVAATATAMFFLFGQVGLAFGPLLTGIILTNFGLAGWQFLFLITLPVIGFALATPYPREVSPQPSSRVNPQDKRNIAWGAIAVLVLLTTFRAWAQLGTVNFTPKLFQDKGWSATSYGAITGVMWFASAITGVVAGNLADRFGKRKVVFWALMLAVPPLFLLPLTDNWLAFPLALLVGGLAGAPHSIIIVIIQNLLPGRKALASGLALGLTFGMGGLATLSIGWLADRISLPVAIQLGAGAALLAAFFALALPETKPTPQVLADEVL